MNQAKQGRNKEGTKELSELETESISVSDALSQIRILMDRIEHSSIYFEMRRAGASYILRESVEVVKAVIALDQMGMVATISIVSALTGRMTNSVRQSMHQLGDKGFLLLGTQMMGGQMVWTLSPEFKAQLVGRI